MNRKEARRVYVMEQVVKGSMTVKQAAECLNLSERQVKRLKKGMKEKGVAALAHGNRGRTPKNAIPKNIRDQVVSLGAGLYKGASAEHIADLLESEDQISISPKSIIRILRENGVLEPVSEKPKRNRKSRDRMPKEGLLVQMDASPHDWLEERGPRFNLHGAIDDARGSVLGLHFCPQENLKGYLEVMHQVITKHGVPRALYTDGHTIFFSPKSDKLTIEQELAGERVALTQFGRVLNQLGIVPIRARSPQAKGRVERLWGTLQSRLMIELRIAGVSSIEEANAFLPGFIERYNKKFAVEAADPESAYRPAPEEERLGTILCAKEQRTASNGSVISYHGTTYRLVDTKNQALLLPPRSKVEVLTHLDGSKDALYQEKRYKLEAFIPNKPKQSQSKPAERKPVNRKPDPNNPWLKFKLTKPKRDPIESYFRKHEARHLSNIS